MSADAIGICKTFYAKRLQKLKLCDAEVRRRNDALEHNLAIARQQKSILTEPTNLLSSGESFEHFEQAAIKNQRNADELFLRNIVTARKSIEDLMGALNGRTTRKFAKPTSK